MKKTLIAGLVVLMLVCGLGFAANFWPPVRGTFVGTTGSWTNATGDRMGIAAVIVHGTFVAGTNSTFYVNNGNGTFILLTDDVTNTLYFLDGEVGIPLEKDGVISWIVSSLGTTTNFYELIFK